MPKPSGSRDVKRAQVAAENASLGMHGVIVLGPQKQPARQDCDDYDSNFKQTPEDPDTNDPAARRRIIRRQAALASAEARKATIAARLGGRSIKPPPTLRGPGKRIRRASQEGLEDPGNNRVGLGDLDPFSSFPVEFGAIKDTNRLQLLWTMYMKDVIPMLEMDIPTLRQPGASGLSWAAFPAMAMQSSCCFWAMMMSMNTHLDTVAGQDPTKSPMTLTMRHLAIRSCNDAIPRLDVERFQDYALPIGIGMLGTWERCYGPPSAWQAHRNGLKSLQRFLEAEEKNSEVISQTLSFILEDGSSVEDAVSSLNLDDLPGDDGAGFARLRSIDFFNDNLSQAVRNCRAIDLMAPGILKQKSIQETLAAIRRFRVTTSIAQIAGANSTLDFARERTVMQMHKVIQNVGILMVHFLAPGVVNDIDLSMVLKQTAEFGHDIASHPKYDEVLLWAMITTAAVYPSDGARFLGTIRILAARKSVFDHLLGDWQIFLRQFVFLNSARQQYEGVRRQIQPLVILGARAKKTAT